MGEAVMFSVPCRFLETRDLSSCDSTRKNISWEWPLSSLPFSGSMPSFSSSVAGRQVFYALIFPLRSNVNNTPFPFVLPRSYFFFFFGPYILCCCFWSPTYISICLSCLTAFISFFMPFLEWTGQGVRCLFLHYSLYIRLRLLDSPCLSLNGIIS